MSDTRKKVFTIFATATGAAAAYFAVRAIIQRLQMREYEAQRQERVQARFQRGIQRDAVTNRSPRYQPQSQPDRQPMPVTGSPGIAGLEQAVTESTYPVKVSDQVEPLVRYLLGFYDMIEMLRAHRRESDTPITPNRPIAPVIRARFADALERLEEQIPDYGSGNLEDNSLQERIYKLIVKMRDALENMEYTEDDLFRINGQVRTEACQVLGEIQEAGEGVVLDFARTREIYECS